MENENNVSGKKSNKLLIALTILVALNLVIGIVNIGLLVNRNNGKHNFARGFDRGQIRQESMFNGFNKGEFNKGEFNKGEFNQGRFNDRGFNQNNRPNFFGNEKREFSAPNDQKNENGAPRINESSGPN